MDDFDLKGRLEIAIKVLEISHQESEVLRKDLHSAFEHLEGVLQAISSSDCNELKRAKQIKRAVNFLASWHGIEERK